MFIILCQPQIPQNTGNIIRLCHNMGATLCLIHPLGFFLTEKHLRRAGLDYIKTTQILEFSNFSECLTQIQYNRMYLLTTKGKTQYNTPYFSMQDALVFGSETQGVHQNVVNKIPKQQRLYIPMQPENRCLNLSNSVSIMGYEVWRQNAFTQQKI